MQLWKFYFLLQITTHCTNTNFLSGSSTTPFVPFQKFHKTLLKAAALHRPSFDHTACFNPYLEPLGMFVSKVLMREYKNISLR